MANTPRSLPPASLRPVALASVLGLGLGAAALLAPPVAPALAVALLAVPVHAWRVSRQRDTGLQMEQIDRLRRAEVALATADSIEAAARELADHALALLGSRSAVVLIEGPGDTVRVTAGDADVAAGSVYGDGSRMRLLEVGGTPVGSIAVGARADETPYTVLDERMLDALGQAVSSSLHRLALFEEVRVERRTLADVLGSSSDGIFSAGPEHRIRSWNPAMERITGQDADLVLGESCCSVFKPYGEDGAPRFGAACPGRAGVASEPVAVRIETLDGEDRWLTCTWSPMSDGGYVVVARDVTAQKKFDDQKAGFLATISHELRTPLTPIKGFIDTLLRQDDHFDADARRRIYQLVLKQADGLERLVNDLILATSLEGADDLFLTEEVDWPRAAEAVVDLFRRQDPTREVTLRVMRNVPPVLADAHRAEQVLNNLIGNAFKYSPPGSPVVVHIERVRGEVVTVVSDAGPGVAPSDRERIFEKFTRLVDHLTQTAGGTGLGLYISRRLVEGMGGTISVGPSSEGGAAFRFTLPAVPARRAGSGNGNGVRRRRPAAVEPPETITLP